MTTSDIANPDESAHYKRNDELSQSVIYINDINHYSEGRIQLGGGGWDCGGGHLGPLRGGGGKGVGASGVGGWKIGWGIGSGIWRGRQEDTELEFWNNLWVLETEQG